MLGALTCLLMFQAIGEIAVKWLHLPLPGPVLGMLLLFFALVIRGGIPPALHSTGQALLQHLMLLFVPAVAGVMLHFQRVAQEWLPILAACVGGSVITLLVTALTLQKLLRRKEEA